MNFFKSNKEIKTEELKLSDYDKIWTKFCFLDETGTFIKGFKNHNFNVFVDKTDHIDAPKSEN